MKSLLILFLTTFVLQSQNSQPIIIGEQITIYSEILKENRTLLIRKPENYTQTGTEKYPVLYLLDGGTNFQHTVATLEFLIGQDRVPEMFIVAITNTNRTRDLTPLSTDDEMPTYPATGGADLFLDFIQNELVTYIDKTYRTQPFKLLVGHSFGGLFAVHSLFSRPKLFNAYIAISPSLWWNKRELVDKVEFYLKQNQFLRGQLYITLGNEGELMEQPIVRLTNVLKANAPRHFDWQFKLMEEESHSSIPLPSTYQGLSFIFNDWRLPVSRNRNFLPSDLKNLLDNEGIEAVLEHVDTHFKNLSDKYGYEIKVPENKINELGYLSLSVDNVTFAIQLFERNVNDYPESANVYDSLADALSSDGQLEKAKLNYYKAVEKAQTTQNPTGVIYKRKLDRIKEILKEQKNEEKALIKKTVFDF